MQDEEEEGLRRRIAATLSIHQSRRAAAGFMGDGGMGWICEKVKEQGQNMWRKQHSAQHPAQFYHSWVWLTNYISICDLSNDTAEGHHTDNALKMHRYTKHTQEGAETEDASQSSKQSLGSAGWSNEEGNGCMEGNIWIKDETEWRDEREERPRQGCVVTEGFCW